MIAHDPAAGASIHLFGTLAADQDNATTGYRTAFGLAPSEMARLGLLFLLLTGHVPVLFLPYWTLRFALTIAVIPIGLVLIVTWARSRDFAALIASVFLMWSLLASVASPAVRVSVTGKWGSNASWLLYLGAICMWAFGRGSSQRVRQLVPTVVAAGLAINVVVGILQVWLGVDSGPLATVAGRASGLLANANYYGALVGGFAVYALAQYSRTERWLWAVAAVLLSFGAGISGSRAILAAVVAISLAVALVARTWRSAFAATGTVLAQLAASVFTSVKPSPSAIERLGQTRDGDGRVQLWTFGLRALRERPIVGWGWGHFGTATRPHYTIEFTRDFASNEVVQAWSDPHNVFVHLAVATGGVGLVLAVAFVVVQLKGVVDPPLLAMVALVGVTWMLEPVHIATLPVTMLLVGLAVAPPVARETRTRSDLSTMQVVLVAGGIVLGALVVIGGAIFESARNRADPEPMKLVASAFLGDAQLTAEISELYTAQWSFTGAGAPDALHWTELAAYRDPAFAYRWAELARRQLAMDAPGDASTSLDRAFRLHPYSPRAWQVEYARILLDGEDADEAERMVCALRVPLCPTLGAS